MFPKYQRLVPDVPNVPDVPAPQKTHAVIQVNLQFIQHITKITNRLAPKLQVIQSGEIWEICKSLILNRLGYIRKS